MAATMISRRICGSSILKKANNGIVWQQTNNLSTVQGLSQRQRRWYTAISALTGSAIALGLAADKSLSVSGTEATPAHLPWNHKGFLETYDHASLRRGFQVYQQLCSTCHSMRFMAYRHLINETHTEDEVKALAADIDIKDGPDDTGEYFTRPGKPADTFRNPYENEEAAKFANGGAMPPDLSYISFARHGGEDYIFALLTGYMDPPAGITVDEGKSYNPYFPGGLIGMPRMIYDGSVEYDDGTPATASQIAKDVSVFLAWASAPEHDERKKIGMKVFPVLAVFTAWAWYRTKFSFAAVKKAKTIYRPKKE